MEREELRSPLFSPEGLILLILMGVMFYFVMDKIDKIDLKLSQRIDKIYYDKFNVRN
jgi:hypothetical protein